MDELLTTAVVGLATLCGGLVIVVLNLIRDLRRAEYQAAWNAALATRAKQRLREAVESQRAEGDELERVGAKLVARLSSTTRTD